MRKQRDKRRQTRNRAKAPHKADDEATSQIRNGCISEPDVSPRQRKKQMRKAKNIGTQDVSRIRDETFILLLLLCKVQVSFVITLTDQDYYICIANLGAIDSTAKSTREAPILRARIPLIMPSVREASGQQIPFRVYRQLRSMACSTFSKTGTKQNENKRNLRSPAAAIVEELEVSPDSFAVCGEPECAFAIKQSFSA